MKEGEQILKEQMRTSLLEYRRDTPALFVSAFSAGLEVGFSLLLMGVLYTLFSDQLSESAMHMAMAMAYPIGFIFVIIGRSELFTEHTTLAVLPVLNRTVSVRALAKLWGIVYAGTWWEVTCLALFWCKSDRGWVPSVWRPSTTSPRSSSNITGGSR